MPSRRIAIFALVAMVLLRGLGAAADAWTANAVECCCSRHSIDHDCGCKECPSHHRGTRSQPDRPQMQSCGHHVELAIVDESPPATTSSIAIVPPAPRIEAAPQPAPSPVASTVVHPETPPS